MSAFAIPTKVEESRRGTLSVSAGSFALCFALLARMT